MEENETDAIEPAALVARILAPVTEACRLATDVEEALVLLSIREVRSRHCTVESALEDCQAILAC